MHRVAVVSSFMIVWTIVTTLALLWGQTFNWPDFVHVDYGLPLSWATNTLSTIAGPADIWSVHISSLLVDLIFWIGIMTVTVTVIVWRLKS